jgi:hypothetical protein
MPRGLDRPRAALLAGAERSERRYAGAVQLASCRRPRSSDRRLRGALLTPLAVLTVHRLRYDLAFGTGAGRELTREGHGYLSAVAPFALLGVAIAVGTFLGALARARRSTSSGAGGSRVPPLASLWPLCAATLLAIFCAQELIEGALSPGHPAGIAAILSHGGWTAVALSLLAGGALASALAVSERLIELAARTRTARRQGRVWSAAGPHHAPVRRDWRLDPRFGVVAGRAPPTLGVLT